MVAVLSLEERGRSGGDGGDGEAQTDEAIMLFETDGGGGGAVAKFKEELRTWRGSGRAREGAVPRRRRRRRTFQQSSSCSLGSCVSAHAAGTGRQLLRPSPRASSAGAHVGSTTMTTKKTTTTTTTTTPRQGAGGTGGGADGGDNGSARHNSHHGGGDRSCRGREWGSHHHADGGGGGGRSSGLHITGLVPVTTRPAVVVAVGEVASPHRPAI